MCSTDEDCFDKEIKYFDVIYKNSIDSWATILASLIKSLKNSTFPFLKKILNIIKNLQIS
ncbi:hypothetical protein BpHYR1_024501 [Brachionus plicatilis]|uniref:Uncharacterized protein n=1 Tax=Brachionus plicatilis TaxID=10195 RepID=A0A3M7R328_BRAPC|nr:hypothetical protein BpHYR1_024501 [Brachionus plicatilis]